MTDADFFDVYIIYYIFAMEESLPGIIILLSDDRVFSFQYLPKVRLAVDTQVYTLESIIFSYDLSLKFLRRFDDSLGYTISLVISGCQFLFLFFLISFDLSDSVLLLNYLLAGLLSRVRLFANLSISACRPYSVRTLLCNLHFSCLSTSIRLSIGFQSFWDLMITGLLWIFPFKV